ncbi:MAG: hypothetical protein ACF8XB_12915 [Planctomycetota bacterium JB042]
MVRSTLLASFASAALALLAPSARADVDPVMSINGASGDNTTIATLTKLTPLNITVTGTPGAPFSILMSNQANTGMANGWFLQPWTDMANVTSPVHPVFDGIGTDYIEQQIGLPATDILPNPNPAPVFRLDASGEFVLNGFVPEMAFLVDENAAAPFGPGNPVPIALEEPARLFMQVVAVDTGDLSVRVGNGMTLDFSSVAFPATVGYSEAQNAAASTFVLDQRQNLGKIDDGDLSDASVAPFVKDPEFQATFGDNVDLWSITLAGPTEANRGSLPVDGMTAPDTALNFLWDYSSTLEFQTGKGLNRNNENYEYPRLVLPGNRELFHWRNGSTNPPSFGFGILFKDTMTFRNLVPPSFGTFTETATRSPWELEVAVTPDGNRALVVLDRSSDLFSGQPYDRAFTLYLEENVAASPFPGANKLIKELTPTSSLGEFRRCWEEGVTFISDSGSGWYAFMTSTTSTSTSESLYPNRMWKVHMNGTDLALKIFPFGDFSWVQHINRVSFANEAADTLCVIAGTQAIAENIISITNVTQIGSYVPLNITQFTGNVVLMESSHCTDGTASWTNMSLSGELFAAATASGTTAAVPFVARTDGATAGNISSFVEDLGQGGQFDLDDFPFTQGLHITDDDSYLLFHQGKLKAGAASDASDQFVVNLTTGEIRNLTRSLKGPEYDTDTLKAYEGPWDLANAAFDAPNTDYGGSFWGPTRDWLFFFKDVHLSSADRFNTYAISVAPALGGGPPTFAMANVNGNEFESVFGAEPPAFGTKDLITNTGFFNEQIPNFFRIRRVGGQGILKNFYYMIGRYADGSAGTTEHLFLFDGANPGPALQLTNYSATSSPISVSGNPTITSITPSKVEPKVAYVLNEVGQNGLAQQELIVQDLNNFGVPVRIPVEASAQPDFDRAITAGSIHWLPYLPGGLVYSAGSTPRPNSGGTPITDGLTAGDDARNPIDATPYFFNFLDPETETPIAAPPALTSRSAMIWGLSN